MLVFNTKTYTTNHFNQPSTYLSITLLKIIMSKFVDYTVFNPEQIVASTPEQKQIPNQTSHYYVIPLRYGSGPLYLQMPQVDTRGISGKEFNNKYVQSLYIPFMADNNCLKEFKTKFEGLYNRCVQLLDEHKDTVELPFFSPPMAPGLFPSPIKLPKDKQTKKPKPDGTPYIAPKLMNAKSATTGKEYKTVFCDLKGESISWDLLTDVSMKCIPLLRVEDIYIGAGKAYLRFKVNSAVVVELGELNSGNRQMETIEELVQRDPSSVDKLLEMLLKLKNKQPQSQSSTPSNDQSLSDNTLASTQDFLSNTNVTEQPPTSQTVPTSSLQDFLKNSSVQPQNSPKPSIPNMTPLPTTVLKLPAQVKLS